MPTKRHFERKSRYEPIFDEKGYPRGKTQSETGEAVEVSVFVPWGSVVDNAQKRPKINSSVDISIYA